MSRVIRPRSPAQTRQACLRQIRRALQPTPVAQAGPPSERERLLVLCDLLRLTAASVEETAAAWEQRDYWAKADRLRREWAWMDPIREGLQAALAAEAPGAADPLLADLLVRLIQLGVQPAPDDLPRRLGGSGSS